MSEGYQETGLPSCGQEVFGTVAGVRANFCGGWPELWDYRPHFHRVFSLVYICEVDFCGRLHLE